MRGEKIHVENERCARAIFGANLRAWRKKRELPLKSVAYESDICIETVSAWEAGDQFPSPENIDKIAQYTGIPHRCLFCDLVPPCPDSCKPTKNSGQT